MKFIKNFRNKKDNSLKQEELKKKLAFCDIEALESRTLLSADPVLGGAQAVLLLNNEENTYNQTVVENIQNTLNNNKSTLEQDNTKLKALDSNGNETIVLDIKKLVNSDGSIETILYIDPKDLNKNIYLGDNSSVNTSAGIYLDTQLFEDIKNKFDSIVIGSVAGSNDFIVLGSNNGADNLQLDDNLYLVSNPNETTTKDTSKLSFINSNTLSVFTADVMLDTNTPFSYDISLTGNQIYFNSDGYYDSSEEGINFNGTINGNNDFNDDKLAILASGNITFGDKIGNTDALEELSIVANNINFNNEVVMNGDLIIDSHNGDIAFLERVVINGNLYIQNADSIEFYNKLDVSGNIYLQGNEIDFNSYINQDTQGNSNRVLTLKPTDKTIDIEIASPSKIGANYQDTNSLNISSTELGYISEKFGKIIIGYEEGIDSYKDTTGTSHAADNLGDIILGQIGVSGFTFKDETYLFGNKIIIDDNQNSSYILSSKDNIHFEAYNDIDIYNKVRLSGDISFYSKEGKISQKDYLSVDNDNKTAEYEFIEASTLTATAKTGIDLNSLYVDNIAIKNTGMGNINVNIVDLKDDKGSEDTSDDTNVSNGYTYKKDLNIISLEQSDSSNTGSTNITTENGQIKILSTANAGKGILINSSGITSIQTKDRDGNDSDDFDILVNNNIQLSSGSLSLNSDKSIQVANNIFTSSSSNSTISYKAQEDIKISKIETKGQVKLEAGKSVVDNLTSEELNIYGGSTSLEIIAGSGIGSEDDINTQVDNIKLKNSENNIKIKEEDSLEIKQIEQKNSGTISVIVKTQDIEQSGDISSESGNINIEAQDGNIIMNDIKQSVSTSADIKYKASEDIRVSIINTSANVILEAGLKILDNLSSENANIIANKASLIATRGIGTNSEELDTKVNSISLTNSVSGGIYIEEDNSINILSVNSQGSNSNLVIVSEDGSINITDVNVSSTDGTGNILVEAKGSSSDIEINSLESTSGNISINAQKDIRINGNIESNGDTKSIELVSNSIRMADGSVINSENGNIILKASNEVLVDRIDAKTGKIAIYAQNSLNDINNDSLIKAQDLLLKAGDIALGNNHLNIQVKNLSIKSDANAFIEEKDSLIIDEIDVEINRVNKNGQALSLDENPAQNSINVASKFVLLAKEGSITSQVNTGNITVLGNSLIKASKTNNNIDSSINLFGNINITNGDLSLISDDSININNNVSLNTKDKTANILANDSIIMKDGSKVSTNDGNIKLEGTNGSVQIELLKAENLSNANIYIKAADKIVDLDENSLILADKLVLSSGNGIGQASNHLNLQVNTLSAKADINSSDVVDNNDIFIKNSQDLIVDSISIDINSVDTSASSSILTNVVTQEDIRTSDNASIILIANKLTLNKGSDDNSVSVKTDGNLKLNALSGSIIFNSSIEANNHISILAHDNISLLSGVNILSINGTIDILASNGFVNMSESSSIKSTNSNIRIEAKDDLSIGKLETSANISLVAGNIYDSSSSKNTQTDISSSKLRVEVTKAQGAFAKADNHLETKVDEISVKTQDGGVFITQNGSINIENISQNDTLVNRVLDTALVLNSNVSDIAQSGITTNSSFILDSISGSIQSINGANISSKDNTLIKTSDGGINLDSSISSQGNISIISNKGLDLSSSASIESTGANSTIDILNNSSFDFNMQDGSFINSNNSNIRVEANNINISSINAKDGNISLVAKGNILDSGDSLVDIVSKDLRIFSLNGGFGNNATLINPLETKVQNLAANVNSNGLYLQEVDSINISKVENISVNIIDSQGKSSIRQDLNLSNIQSKQDVQINANEAINVKKSSDKTSGINASSNITLNSLRNAISIENEINSENGNISINAFESITQDTAIKTQGENKNISLISQNAHIEMLESSSISNEKSGDIILKANTSITTENITGTSNVVLEAKTSFVKDIDENSLIKANSLKINAGTKIGSFNNFINTDISSLEADSLSKNLYLEEKDNVVIKANKLLGSIIAKELTLNVINIGDENNYLETKIDILNSNTDNKIFLKEKDNLTINTNTLLGSIKADEVTLNGKNIGKSDSYLKTEVNTLNINDLNEKVYIEEKDSVLINTNNLLGSVKAQDLIIKGSNIGSSVDFLNTQVNTLDINSSNSAFIKEFDSLVLKDSKVNNIFALETLKSDINLDKIEAKTVSLKVSDNGRILDNNDNDLNIKAEELNILGRGAYSQGASLNSQLMKEAIEVDVNSIFMASHNDAKVVNYVINNVNYGFLVEKNTYSLQYVSNKNFSAVSKEQNSNLASNMKSIAMWDMNNKLNYQLLNLSSNINNSYYEYKSKEQSSLSTVKSLEIKNTFAFDKEQVILTKIDDRVFDNQISIIDLKSANNIFDYEEDYELWVEDLAL